MNYLLPAEFITSPLMAAANLIGVITSDKALADAKNDFPKWLIGAHKCAGIMTMQVCQRFHEHGRNQGQQGESHP